MIDREKSQGFFLVADLLQGKFDRAIELLESKDDIPFVFRRALASMMRKDPTSSELQLFVHRRDGRKGAPMDPLDRQLRKIELGERVHELIKGRGDYAVSVQDAAKQFGVKERTAQTAYAYVKKMRDTGSTSKLRS
ncbi:MAG: hypothetical protein O3A85_14150 [Proteobacteria bacterium]|nr:hypothetical protein [Pseudomonadota bacterium]